jgi:Ni/Fe-hydrogenase 1 B-type cytochrome subunit
MGFGRYVQDYYGDWRVAQLLPATAICIILLSVLFIGVHLFRRSWGEPLPTEADPHKITHDAVKYELGARLYHWGNFLFLAGLILSGLALFVPGSLRPFRVSWFLGHEIFAGLFVAGLLLHIVVATWRGDPRSMWFSRRDLDDLRVTSANFLGTTRAYPRFGKYDPWQKLFHAVLTLLSVVMIFTGFYLFLSAEGYVTFTHEWLRWQRLSHDFVAFIFVAMIVAHIYFGLIRVNWPNLIAMFTGRVSARYFRLRHSSARWPIEK